MPFGLNAEKGTNGAAGADLVAIVVAAKGGNLKYGTPCGSNSNPPLPCKAPERTIGGSLMDGSGVLLMLFSSAGSIDDALRSSPIASDEDRRRWEKDGNDNVSVWSASI